MARKPIQLADEPESYDGPDRWVVRSLVSNTGNDRVGNGEWLLKRSDGMSFTSNLGNADVFDDYAAAAEACAALLRKWGGQAVYDVVHFRDLPPDVREKIIDA